MSLHLVIPDALATGLEARAAAVGVTPEEVALAAIRRELTSVFSREAMLAQVRNAYSESEMDEDESLDFLEAEKHAMRLERRAGNK